MPRSSRADRRDRRDTPAACWRAAVHEAGHAVACVRLKRRVRRVTLLLNAHTMGEVELDTRLSLHPRRSPDPARAAANVIREVVIGWAGYVAEQMFFGRAERGGLLADARSITLLLARLASGQRQRNRLGRCLLQECRQLLAPERKTIERVARALRERRRLSGAELRRLA